MRTIAILAVWLVTGLVACKRDNDMSPVLTPGPDQLVYGINANNELIKFNAKTPAMTINKAAVTGLGSGEKLISIDFRPATGELYALSNASRLYIVNQETMIARVVGSTAFTPAISGTIISIDFNPTVDRIRLVSDNGQNLRLHPETGMVAATDGMINGTGTPKVTGIAYTNSKAGAASTVLYDIDGTTGKLYKQDPPNNGTLAEVGALGITFTSNAAFDIMGESTALLAAGNGFYTIDLMTGKAAKIGMTAELLIDLAVPVAAVAYATDTLNNFYIFNPADPAAGMVTKTIIGLQVGETIAGIDFRPLNGQLYALGSTSRLYTINLSSGAATQVGSGIFSTLLSGTDFGFDFNPTVDRIRVVSNTGQNLRLNPNDGTVAAVDGMLNPGVPAISAAAYTNNFAGTSSTILLVIDPVTDKLYRQDPPNNGTLVETGSLGIDINAANGFDISSRGNTALLLAGTSAGNRIYSINLSTGQAGSPVVFPTAVKGFSLGTGF